MFLFFIVHKNREREREREMRPVGGLAIDCVRISHFQPRFKKTRSSSTSNNNSKMYIHHPQGFIKKKDNQEGLS